MIDFTPKNETTPGQVLYTARARLGLSLDACSSRTRIPAQSLRALEHDNWAALPAPVYVKGFIRAYATELGLDPDPIVEAWRAAGGDRRLEPYLVSTTPFALKEVKTDRKGAVWGVAAGLAVGAAVLAIWLFGGWTGSQTVLGDNGDAGIEVPVDEAGESRKTVSP